MALVITLILLSIITFMAIAFLVLSHTQRSSTNTATQQSIARLGADAGLARAQADVLAHIMANNNEFNYGLMVSRNFINRDGFIPGNTSWTNVNYDYTVNGTPLTGADFLQNVANLCYDPRPPVFMPVGTTGTNEFRFYLDLNRNRRFEDTGLLPEMNPLGGYYNRLDGSWTTSIDGNTLSNYFVGDPQWIGGLEFPGQVHSRDNQFIYRYAYQVVPAGEALDINYIHNQAKQIRASDDGFQRNQGAGTYEINLASLLVDLNTNQWGALYQYDQEPNRSSVGPAFEDALSLLLYRYNKNYQTLARLDEVFPNSGPFLYDCIDGFCASDPRLKTVVDPDQSFTATRRWSGANNTNHFFTSSQDLFDPNKVSAPFYNRLMAAGTTSLSSYDRYTYYRLLSQLGTDSAPETGKINLNYRNVDDQGNIVPDLATNFLAWEAEHFFTNTANKLFKNAGYKFTTANIQVYPTNYYTPSVHQMLQLAANIYDATTNRTLGVAPEGFPTVFRPVFLRTATNVVICGYREVVDADVFFLQSPTNMDLLSSADIASLPLNQPSYKMFYGVPLVIGARKGFPNFNQFYMQLAVTVARKLQFTRNSSGGLATPKQVINVGISNVLGAQLWNSYTNDYKRPLELIFDASVFSYLSTNQQGAPIPAAPGYLPYSPGRLTYNLPAWPGCPPDLTYPWVSNSFKVPLDTAWWHLTNSTWNVAQGRFEFLSDFVVDSTFASPRWYLNTRAHIVSALVDTSVTPHRIVDYVNLDEKQDPVDILSCLTNGMASGQSFKAGSMWNPTLTRDAGLGITLPQGVENQIAASLTVQAGADWGKITDYKSQIDRFRVNYGLSAIYYPQQTYTKSNFFWAPYPVSRTIYAGTSWQANDPLVHYTIGDLTGVLNGKRVTVDSPPANGGVVVSLRQPTTRYEPWGGSPVGKAASTTKKDLGVKDPMVTRADDWDFPTNKFANIGWLGRVHRGTPWQTVYLKSKAAVQNTWQAWCGNSVTFTNDGRFDTGRAPLNSLVSDAALTRPTNDWALLDMFTTAFNDNSSRGKLSVNQSGLAAWSAVLGGVVALTNDLSLGRLEPIVIEPAGAYGTNVPPLVRMVNAMNAARAAQPTKAFKKLGDILAVPELTVESPFLNTVGTAADNITDAAYERIPQQVLGLLKCDHTPRFVVYSYGQALKPANKGIVTSGTQFGLCTNYQVTAEVATRTVIRVEGAPQKPRAVIESFNLLGPE